MKKIFVILLLLLLLNSFYEILYAQQNAEVFEKSRRITKNSEGQKKVTKRKDYSYLVVRFLKKAFWIFLLIIGIILLLYLIKWTYNYILNKARKVQKNLKEFTADSVARKALSLFEKGEPDPAIDSLYNVVHEVNLLEHEMIKLSLFCEKFKKYDLALKLIERVLSTTQAVKLYLKAAELCINLSVNQKAIMYINKAKASGAISLHNLLKLKKLYMRLGDTSQAIDTIKQIFLLNYQAPEIIIELADLYKKSGKIEQAIITLEKVPKIEENQTLLLELIDLKLKSGMYSEVVNLSTHLPPPLQIEKLKECLQYELKPDLVEKVIEIFGQFKDFASIVEIYIAYKEKMQFRDRAFKRVAEAYYNCGKIDEFIQLTQQFVQQKKQFYDLYELYIKYLLENREYKTIYSLLFESDLDFKEDVVKKLLKEISAMAEGEGYHYLLLKARLNEQIGNVEEASFLYNEISNFTEAVERLACISSKLRKEDETLKHYRILMEKTRKQEHIKKFLELAISTRNIEALNYVKDYIKYLSDAISFLSLFEKDIETSGTFYQSFSLLLAKAYYQVSDFNKAFLNFNKISRLSTDDLMLKFDAAVQAKEIEAARKTGELLLESRDLITENLLSILNFYVLICDEKGFYNAMKRIIDKPDFIRHLKELKRLIKKILAKNIDSASAKFFLSIVYFNEEKREKAFAFLSEATELAINIKDFDLLTLIEQFVKSLHKEHEDPLIRVILADIAKASGRFDEAVNILLYILERSPDNQPILFKIAELYFLNKNYKEAEFYLKRLISLDRKNALYHKYFVKVKLEKKEKAKALKILKEYLTENPGDRELKAMLEELNYEVSLENFEKGKNKYEAGRYNEAIACFQKVDIEYANLKNKAMLYTAASFFAKGLPDVGKNIVDNFNLNKDIFKDLEEYCDFLYDTAACLEKYGYIEEALVYYKKILINNIAFKDTNEKIDLLEKKIKLIFRDKADPVALQNIPSRYTNITFISKGGMGEVYRAFDNKLDRIVAIKSLIVTNMTNKKELKRFVETARAISDLRHPSIFAIYDIEEFDKGAFIIMEYIEGITLREYLNKEEKLSEKECIKLIRPVLSALLVAHKNGIVHRDIKPENIMLTSDNFVKLIDFGLARIEYLTTMTTTGAKLGTPFYMSPEQIVGEKVDVTSDIYAIGIILYEMLSGSPPFVEGDIAFQHLNIPPKSLIYDLKLKIDEKFENIILKCLRKDKKERYQNVEEILEDLSVLDRL